MDLDEKKYWLAFNVFEGIGNKRFKLLKEYFGSAKLAYLAKENKLREINLGEKLIENFLRFRQEFDFSSYNFRLESLGITVICLEEENYPKLLKEISDAPSLIYIKMRDLGNFGVWDKKSVAVVGTRKVTGYGRQVTEMITEGLVNSGLVIVSGLARGVDKIAHETAINNKGLTIGVLACGLDMIYPPEHKGLAEKIIETGGAIISEYPLGQPAMPGNFPARNRIISGLSLGVVVTEAAQDSGSLITASCAADQGRDVFAIPGPITSPLSAGTSELLKKGAKVVTGVQDILDELCIMNYELREKGKKINLDNLTNEEKKICEILENETMHIDEIARKMGNESGKLGSILSLMEIKGILINLGEGVYGVK